MSSTIRKSRASIFSPWEDIPVESTEKPLSTPQKSYHVNYFDRDIFAQSYYCHEAWFELESISKWRGDEKAGMTIKGKRLVNSYGRVREVWEDGTYQDIYDGKRLE